MPMLRNPDLNQPLPSQILSTKLPLYPWLPPTQHLMICSLALFSNSCVYRCLFLELNYKFLWRMKTMSVSYLHPSRDSEGQLQRSCSSHTCQLICFLSHLLDEIQMTLSNFSINTDINLCLFGIQKTKNQKQKLNT